jgi:hypothetical protein
MSSITLGSHEHDVAAGHAHDHGHHAGFISTYIFSRDHKIIGIQFLFSTLIWFFIGGLLALGVRWQLAWPWSDMPIMGRLFADQGGQIAPEHYTMLFTMHATGRIWQLPDPADDRRRRYGLSHAQYVELLVHVAGIYLLWRKLFCRWQWGGRGLDQLSATRFQPRRRKRFGSAA